ncbi:MAG: beta-ketoacyl synthase N-terminal-like domain-containing protein [Chitinophagales bacterium]
MEAILKKSLVTIKKLEAEVNGLKNSANEPIAIIGMGCRMPGDVHSPEDLWNLLVNKKDTITEIPKDRWDADSIYDEDPLTPGKTNAKHGSFLSNDVKTFDADFFGIPPREAKSIDPLQRMLLEVTQETLEKAGISPDSLRGSKTGVFLGLGNSDYMQARLRSGHLEDVDVYDATGVPFATAAGRLSYMFDLQGPSFALDSACSSAIVGMHLAANSLRNKESNLAIVGAANLILTPELYVGLSKLGSLATDGKCKAFDENADGYVRGEGCGVVILKRLSEAEADGDNVLAIIKGSAVQHDGLSNGFTAPNPEVQLKVIQEALKNANVDPATIDFVEAHGIGNKFTDAMEIQAIQQSYGKREQPIYVGSVKPNIGHLEAAVGMAMLAKIIGSFQHHQIAPNIHIDTPNQDLDWNNIKVKVPTDTVNWNSANSDQPLRAAINLSGYSGTNVHMIFEAPKPKAKSLNESKQPVLGFNISAKTKQALDQSIENYIQFIESNPTVNFNDLLYTLSAGRSHYDYKLSAIVENKDDLLEALKNYQAEGKHKNVSVNNIDLVRNKDIAFLFTGQGAQYHGMCSTLYQTNSTFKNAVDRCNEILKPHLALPIIEVLYGDDTESINQTIYTQPALFVVEYALYELWKSWGIQPTAVIGHSVGEFVALTVAGVLSLEDALLLIAKRGQLMQSLPEEEGGMAAVLANEATVLPYLTAFKQVNIAAVNSPKALTISGNKEEIDQVVVKLKEEKVKAINLTVSHAFHSYLMDPILADFEAVAASVQLNEPQIPVISNVTGKELQLSDISPQYFSKHIRGTVRYWDNIQYLDQELGIDVFLEAGPNPTLIGLAKQGLTKETALLLSSAKKGQDDWKMMWTALQELYLADVSIDWKSVYQEVDAQSIELPTYPWQRKEYWYNPVRLIIEHQQEPTPVKDKIALNTAMSVNKDNLMDIMQREAVKILGLEKGSQLDIYKSIREQGFDSMMSGEFLAKMEKYLGAKLEMSLIHVYSDLNSLYNYIVKDIIGDKDEVVSMSDVMFDANSSNGLEEEEEEGDWHDIKPTDGPLMKLFKKFDKALGVDGKSD